MASHRDLISWVLQLIVFVFAVCIVVFVFGAEPEAALSKGTVDCGTSGVDVVFTWVRHAGGGEVAEMGLGPWFSHRTHT